MIIYLLFIYFLVAVFVSLCTVGVPFQKKGTQIAAWQKVLSGAFWPILLALVIVVSLFGKSSD